MKGAAMSGQPAASGGRSWLPSQGTQLDLTSLAPWGRAALTSSLGFRSHSTKPEGPQPGGEGWSPSWGAAASGLNGPIASTRGSVEGQHLASITET